MNPRLSPELLEALHECWARHEVAIVDHLRPGLARDELDRIEEELGFELPQELRLWWSWHDGQECPIDRREIHAGPDLLSARQAVAQTRSLLDIARMGEEDDPPGTVLWQEGWVPFTHSLWGGVLACAPIAVRYVDFWIIPTLEDPVATSLGQLIAWWIELYEIGVYAYDPEHSRWTCNGDIEPKPGDPTFWEHYSL